MSSEKRFIIDITPFPRQKQDEFSRRNQLEDYSNRADFEQIVFQAMSDMSDNSFAFSDQDFKKLSLLESRLELANAESRDRFTENDLDTNDIFALYLSDIRVGDFLNAGEERFLGVGVQLANQARKYQSDCLEQKKEISAKQSELLQMIIAFGDRCKDVFVRSNLPLVIGTLKSNVMQSPYMQDYFQNGTIGLLVAVGKFDPTKGVRFSTYATNWIKQKYTRAKEIHERTIYLPTHIVESLQVLKKLMYAYQSAFSMQDKPTAEELFTAIQNGIISYDRSKNPLKLQFGDDMQSIADLVFLMDLLVENSISLDSPIGSEQDTEFGELLASDGNSVEEDALHSLEMSILRAHIEGYVSDQKKRNRKGQIEKNFNIFLMYYGMYLNDAGVLSYQDQHNETKNAVAIAKQFGLTRERVRQIASEERKLFLGYLKRKKFHYQ